jgi:type I restriction enzyme M protein
MSPFNEARYARLLEGQEIAERKLSELERTWRIDAEFFRHRHLVIEKKLAANRCDSVAGVAVVTDGNHFSISESFVEDGIPYYRGQDVVGHFFIEQASPNRITRAAFEQSFMKRSHLKQGDVLLSIIGTVGETSLVKTTQEATCSCKLAILRPKGIEPAYLATYLSSAVGRVLTERWKRGAVQTGLLLEDMDQVPVPRFSKTFEGSITSVVNAAYEAQCASAQLLVDAESSLRKALGLEGWEAPEPLSYVLSSRDAFVAGRLDAEHFQPKYKAMIDVISRSISEFDLVSLGRLSAPLKYGCSEKLEYVKEGRVFLRIADLEGKRFNHESVLHVQNSVEFGESDLVEENDVLISRSGTLGVAVPIKKEFAGSAYGSYFIRSRPDISIVHPEFLALFINSLAGQMQVEEKNTGGIQTNLTIPAIESLLIPIGPMNWQMQFVELVNMSFSRRQFAAQLIDAAKRAVEIAIEENEEVALEFLKAYQ